MTPPPLPRFHRLPPERQAEILAVARAHFAEYGTQDASYNRIIEAAGMSKTAAYHYFDGREDLLGAVLDEVLARVLAALGVYSPAPDPAAFWSRLESGADALTRHLATHPDDLALAGAALARAGGSAWRGWFVALVEDGRRLGIVRTDIDTALMASATAAVLGAADEWALPELAAGRALDRAPVWLLLRGLWGGGSTEGAGDAR